MDSELIREILDRLRKSLMEQGPFGRFLVGQIDEAVAQGVEERSEDRLSGSRGNKKELIDQRPATDPEILEAYVRVIEAYTVELPIVASTAEGQLSESFQVQRVVISFDTEEDRSSPDSRFQDVLLSEIADVAHADRSRRALDQFRNLVAQANAQNRVEPQ